MSSVAMLVLSTLAMADSALLPAEPPPPPTPQTWTALRVAIDCQDGGRTKACSFLRSFLDDHEVLASAPRADAAVVLYVDATERTSDDLLLLRFVSSLPGAPASFEVMQTLDTRTSDDEQRAALEPAFLRGIAPFVTALNPRAVSVTLSAPEDATEEQARTSPWGAGLYLGGWGSWTADFQSLDVWDGLYLYRTTTRSRFITGVSHDAALSYQPSLHVESHDISLDSSRYSVGGSALYGYNLNDHWTVGGVARGGHEDPDDQYLGTARLHAAVERNWFPSDDPRGNRLAATYLLGGQADWYNHTNQLGEDQAFFLTHGLQVQGSVRVDTVDLTLELGANAQLLHPLRRYVLYVGGDAEITLGDHVDLSFELGLTRQAIPGPAEIDTSSYEAVIRSGYAEPLDLWGHTQLRLHRDHSNGQRNNRFDTVDGLGNTSNL